MSEKLIIIGAGGHGQVVADIAQRSGYTDIRFVDDYSKGECMGYPICGTCRDLNAYNDGETDFVIAVGNNVVRQRIAEAYDLKWVTLIHPSAQIGSHVRIDVGTVIMANAVVNACATVGKHCIINSGAIVEHDNVLENYVHISPRAALGGTVTVCAGTHIGIGAMVRNNLTICNNCVIGIGAVVVKDIQESGTYVGIPARKLENK